MNSRYKDFDEVLKKKAVLLVAVTKTRPNEAILGLYNEGQRDFGENRVQELREKYVALPKDIRWHLIGHLQTNKVKYIAEWVHLVHSVDSLELLKEINRQALKHNRIISCLLQIFIADETTKFGFTKQEVIKMLDDAELNNFKNIKIAGLMGMATNTNDEGKVRNEFKSLKELFLEIKEKYYPSTENFTKLSMGMSGDYLIAIEEGATIVRIGSLLF